MHNIKISIQTLAPSKNEHSTLIPRQYLWRTEHKFIGENEIGIADIQEPIWWNRPLTSDIFCKQEDDGLYSYNLPFWEGEKRAFKTGYNVLLNKNSVPIAVHLQIDDTWTDEQRTYLDDMVDCCLYNTLIELGVFAEDLNLPRNDFYWRTKKFACGEKIFKDNVFTQNTIVTLRMQPEKEIFDRLTGKYAHAKEITGIIEEVPGITKAKFIEVLIKHLQSYVDTYLP